MPRLPAALLAFLSLSGPAVAQPEPQRFAGTVAAHNQARQAVSVPPLQWSAELAVTAQRWADKLRESRCAMRHSGAAGLGENLAWASGQALSPGQVVGMWVGERRDYDATRNSCAPGKVCGHYTQVVWRSTTHVGCGMASCGNSEVWVCNYTPPGNYVGQRPH
jgi:pathogenesis-related protein 1